MKIAHVIFSLENGGSQNMMVDIADEQIKLGHSVSIIIINNVIEESIFQRINPNIKIFYLKRKRGSRNLIPIIKLFIILRFSNKIDVLHCHDGNLGKLFKRLCSIPCVCTIHDVGISVNNLEFYNKLFAISNAVKKDIEERSKFTCELVYNGVKTEDIRQRSHKNIDNLRIVSVSRLMHEKKGQDILLKALNISIIQNSEINISLDFVGDGESMKYLIDLTNSLHLSQYVNFLGNKPREWIYENLCKYDLFIQPSRYEGFGLTVAEAMAAKVPVIATHNDGPAEVLCHGKYGIIFENGNIYDLTNKILSTMALYKTGGINNIIEDAYKHCKRTFDIHQTAINYCEKYL